MSNWSPGADSNTAQYSTSSVCATRMVAWFNKASKSLLVSANCPRAATVVCCNARLSRVLSAASRSLMRCCSDLGHLIENICQLAEFAFPVFNAGAGGQISLGQPLGRCGQGAHLLQNKMFAAEPGRAQRQQTHQETGPRHVQRVLLHPGRRELPEPRLVDDIRQHQRRRDGHKHAGHQLHPHRGELFRDFFNHGFGSETAGRRYQKTGWCEKQIQPANAAARPRGKWSRWKIKKPCKNRRNSSICPLEGFK